MLCVAVLGARGTGKTTLAHSCLGASTRTPRETTTAFHSVVPESVSNAKVLDPAPLVRAGDLARDLARRTVAATLITLPRDADSAQQAQSEVLWWSNFARAHTHRSRLALVVTKKNVRHPPLAEHQFDQSALETMRVAGVERIFYTDAATQGAEGLRHWLLDVLRERQPSLRECPSSDSIDFRSLYSFELGRRNANPDYVLAPKDTHEQRTCDNCVVC